MVLDRLERVLAGVRGDWLGAAAGVAGRDLADDRLLGELVGLGPEVAAAEARVGEAPDEEPDEVAFLRSSRLPRLRPILVVLAARASGGGAADPELQYAAELLHTALALHDAAVGPRKNKRRALARQVLRSVGWMGSNRVLLRAMELARHAGAPGVIDELLDALRGFQEAQEVVARLQETGVPTVDDWSHHADGHTGALLAFCCRAGAALGAVGEADVAAFGRFGRHLGRMWHLAEDVVLLQDEAARTYLVGRALAGRPMLPVAIAATRDPLVADLWRALVEDHDAAAADELVELLRRTRAIHGTREIMAREHWAARQELARFPDTPHRHALERLASGVSRAPYEDRPPELDAYR
ncbi:MAG: polyprenyl synthetase family protein [Alphaproteobacteria bacterium]|nr:polyprenyl synthetase family protein [Alphaproteobacteria bacterium]